MGAEDTCFSVFKEFAEGKGGGRESHFLPGNLLFGEQGRLYAFFTVADDAVFEAREEVDIHLIRLGKVIDRQHLPYFNFRARLFPGFADGAVFSLFEIFEVAGGKVPVAAARLDGAATEQHLILPYTEGAHHQFGIGVVDGIAMLADDAFAAFGWLEDDRLPAGAAKFLEWEHGDKLAVKFQMTKSSGDESGKINGRILWNFTNFCLSIPNRIEYGMESAYRKV